MDEREIEKGITCDNCGASDIEIVSNEYGKCRYCDSQVKLQHQVVNNYYIAPSQESGNGYYVIEGKVSEKEFLKMALFTISLDYKTPIDVLTANFENVKMKYPQYMIINGHYQGSVSASIGYNRQEQYWGTQRIYRNGESYDEPVLKERTVTDWKPYTCQVSCFQRSCVKINEKDDNTSSILNDNLDGTTSMRTDYSQSKYQNIGFVEPNSECVELALSKGRYQARETVSFPGDKVKDVRANISAKIESKDFYMVPQYSLKYKYKDDECEVNSFTYALHIDGEVPDVTDEINDEVNKNTKAWAITTICSSALSIILALINVIFSITSSSLFWLPIIGLVITIVFYVVYKQQKSKTQRNILSDRRIAKRDALVKYLQEKDLPPLTAEEFNKFGGENNAESK